MTESWTPKEGDRVWVWRAWPNRDGLYPVYGTITWADSERAAVIFDEPQPCDCGCGMQFDGDLYRLDCVTRLEDGNET